jgi:hypothetical protein
MTTRHFALVMGIVFLLVGILGFVPGINQMHGDHPGLTVDDPGHGYLLGLFHVNVLHNAVHLLFGILGIAMSRRYDAARLYARIVAIAYALLAVMGLLPEPFRNTFGLVPIEGHDVWLHLLIAAAAAYFGFVVPATEMPTDEYSATGTPRQT